MKSKEIAEKIFWSPATNGKHLESLSNGEQMISDYTKNMAIAFAEWAWKNKFQYKVWESKIGQWFRIEDWGSATCSFTAHEVFEMFMKEQEVKESDTTKSNQGTER